MGQKVKGSKGWFLKYRKDGVEKHMALGGYPVVTFATARLARDQAKLKKLSCVDPIETRLDEKRLVTQSTDLRANFVAIACVCTKPISRIGVSTMHFVKSAI